MQSNENTVEGGHIDGRLIIRSNDLETRILIHIQKNTNIRTILYPYTLTIYNLAIGDRDGSKPILFKQGDTVSEWIEAG